VQGRKLHKASRYATKDNEGSNIPQTELELESASRESSKLVYVPAGSIISTTLLSGIDALTGDDTKSNPIPSLAKITDLIITPNGGRIDLDGCHAVVSGYGELSSHRVQIRGELISCVLPDGTPAEGKPKMWASGEDGKTGVRGRLVSKQGQLIARSALAGFAENFSSLFTNIPIPTINTGTDIAYSSQLTGQNLQNAGLSGAAKALEGVSSFLIKMAEKIFPVLEVGAGRKVEFETIQGFWIIEKKI